MTFPGSRKPAVIVPKADKKPGTTKRDRRALMDQDDDQEKDTSLSECEIDAEFGESDSHPMPGLSSSLAEAATDPMPGGNHGQSLSQTLHLQDDGLTQSDREENHRHQAPNQSYFQEVTATIHAMSVDQEDSIPQASYLEDADLNDQDSNDHSGQTTAKLSEADDDNEAHQSFGDNADLHLPQLHDAESDSAPLSQYNDSQNDSRIEGEANGSFGNERVLPMPAMTCEDSDVVANQVLVEGKDSAGTILDAENMSFGDGANLAFPHGSYFVDISVRVTQTRCDQSEPERGSSSEKAIANPSETISEYNAIIHYEALSDLAASIVWESPGESIAFFEFLEYYKGIQTHSNVAEQFSPNDKIVNEAVRLFFNSENDNRWGKTTLPEFIADAATRGQLAIGQSVVAYYSGQETNPSRYELSSPSFRFNNGSNYEDVSQWQSKCTTFLADVLYNSLSWEFNAHPSDENPDKFFPYKALQWRCQHIDGFEMVTSHEALPGDIWANGSHVGIYLGTYNNIPLFISARSVSDGVHGVQPGEGIQIKKIPLDEGAIFKRFTN